MTFEEFAASTSSPRPAYLLISEQEHLRRQVLEHARRQVEEAARSFDWALFDLAKDPVEQMVNLARTLPWLSPFRWIYVRHAELGQEPLEAYLKDPSPRTVLILEASRKVKGGPSLALIEEDKQGPTTWVQSRVRQEGYRIEPKAVQALVDLAGEDRQRLEGELEKLFLYQLESRRIDLESVLEMAQDAREFTIFALMDALAARQARTALRILDQLLEGGMSPPLIVAMLYWNFRRLLVAQEMLGAGKPFFPVVQELKIWSYKNRERELRNYPAFLLFKMVCGLREVDRLLKTTSTDPRLHLERLIVDTCRKPPV